MAIVVFLGNITGGLLPSVRAALAQALLSFVILGVNMALHEETSRRYGRIPSILVPALFTTTLAGVLHGVCKTPNVGVTLLIVFGSAILGFSFWAEVGVRCKTIQPLDIIRLVLIKMKRRL